MAEVKRGTFELSPWAFALAALPLVVIVLSGVIISLHGYPNDHLANAVVQNGHAEAAGRLKMLATGLLVAGACFGCIFYFLWNLRLFAPASAKLLFGTYLLLAAGGALSIYLGFVEGGERYVDERIVCAAFTVAESAASPADRQPDLKAYAAPRPHMWSAPRPCPGNRNFALLLGFNEIQKYLIALLIPALALGTISCLALPRRPTEADCRHQVQRLNTHLYLTATVLVLGLLFLSAMLHWPGFAFRPAAGYKAHVDAYILYWGVTYSVFIASYYVPVAIGLTRRCGAAQVPARAKKGDKDGDGKGQDDTPASELFSLLKTLAALFAPAITGLLGTVVSL